MYADCAVNVDPNAEQLAHIAVDSADTAAAFGIEPRVAMLSYSTLGSGAGPQVGKAAARAYALVWGCRCMGRCPCVHSTECTSTSHVTVNPHHAPCDSSGQHHTGFLA